MPTSHPKPNCGRLSAWLCALRLCIKATSDSRDRTEWRRKTVVSWGRPTNQFKIYLLTVTLVSSQESAAHFQFAAHHSLTLTSHCLWRGASHATPVWHSPMRPTGTCERTQAIGVYTPSHHRCSVEEEETGSACVLGLVWHSTPAPQRKGLPVLTQRQAWSDGSTGLACCGPCSSYIPTSQTLRTIPYPTWLLRNIALVQMGTSVLTQTPIHTHTGPRPTLTHLPPSWQSPASPPSL